MLKNRRMIRINGKTKRYSHVVWHAHTGHWPVVPDEVVHHIDGDPTNDSFNNLQLMSDFEHRSLHTSGKNHYLYGKSLSEETKAKISASKMGTICTEETKAKMSKTKMGSNNPNFGKPRTEEIKAKISASTRGDKNYNWQGDSATPAAKYMRIYRAQKRTTTGEIQNDN